jgi:hypothetical protein
VGYSAWLPLTLWRKNRGEDLQSLLRLIRKHEAVTQTEWCEARGQSQPMAVGLLRGKPTYLYIDRWSSPDPFPEAVPLPQERMLDTEAVAQTVHILRS